MTTTKTALITGASSGIGEAFAKCYARAGYQLILIARDTVRLHQVATQCHELSGYLPVVISIDLARPAAASEIYQELQAKQIRVDVLVNNAGFGMRSAFVTQPMSQINSMIQVHITVLTELTHLFLRDMLERRQGKIVNIASVYGYLPIPLQTIYGATKAFVVNFSLGLAEEVKSSGVTVTAVCPGMTGSAFHERAGMQPKKNSLLMMSADAVARAAFPSIEKGQPLIIPGVLNKLFVAVVSRWPKLLMAATVSWVAYKFRKVD